MADISPGFSFGANEQVTNTKLAQLASGTLLPTVISTKPVDSSVQTNDVLLYLQTSSATLRSAPFSAIGSISTAGTVSKAITQTSHGFTVGTVLYFTGTAYAGAEANALATSEIVGIVSGVIDGNTFTLAQSGFISGLTGLIAGSQYFLSPTSPGTVTVTSPTTAGFYVVPVLIALSATTAILDIATPQPYTFSNGSCNGRLTLSSGVPITTGNVASAGTLFFTPFKGNAVDLYDGTKWSKFFFTQLSLSLTALTQNVPIDVFIFNNSGTLTLSTVNWTNSTTRATALTLQDGVEVLTGTTTKRYLGTIYLNGVGTTEDSTANRLVYNRYNQVPRNLSVNEATANWTYSVAAWRQANANTANKVNIVVGLSEQMMTAKVHGTAEAVTGSQFVGFGVGINSTTVNSAQLTGCHVNTGSNASDSLCDSYYDGFLVVGFNVINWIEFGNASGTNFFANNNPMSGGLMAEMMM